MHVLFVSQLFETGNDPGSDRNLYFCRQLLAQGHKVTVITSNVDYKKATEKFPGEGWKVYRNVDGIDVWYVYSYSNFRGSFLKRFWYYMTYMLPTLLVGLQIKNTDIVYAVSTPLNVGFLGYVLSRIKRIPFVFEVTDVWPDAAVASGVVKSQLLISAAKALERFCYKAAHTIVALTEGIKDNIHNKGIPLSKLALITNGVDLSLFPGSKVLDAERDETRDQLDFANRFVCMYLGAHGAYNALWTIIETAEELRNDPRCIFVFVGDGDEKPRLQSEVQLRNLTNVRFLDSVPRSQTPKLLNAADAFLLPNRRGEFYTGNLPNKLFDFLASGRPIVVAGKGETADLVLRANAGKVVDAEDGKAMAAAISELASADRTLLETMGFSAQSYVTMNYSREILSKKYVSILENAVGEK
ncbi:hypothetical protein AXX12_08320 [Anaerosporomusa subterranea]|uniref:Glycosyltransferase subfamily 4-like N-terminal domain-containing protein n=1 Tax=Anaerosporomusa subterranea TaxID=1794912 RepID=A0A154BRA5_ANASB|nr:glycosyltransferase family 4 protein [Anaerosporomusa subterranea]KYZ76429.1 hypothetical protein AXX12_08320 [Anaerosporomusa subterranea]